MVSKSESRECGRRVTLNEADEDALVDGMEADATPSLGILA